MAGKKKMSNGNRGGERDMSNASEEKNIRRDSDLGGDKASDHSDRSDRSDRKEVDDRGGESRRDNLKDDSGQRRDV
jgi:hypothetical protein